jgi:hypothetical protein
VWAELLGICFFRSVPEDVVEEIGEKGGCAPRHVRIIKWH